MKAVISWTFVALAMLGGVSLAEPAEKKDTGAGTAREQLVGTWRLAWLDEPGADGNMKHITAAKGSLIYTPPGIG